MLRYTAALRPHPVVGLMIKMIMILHIRGHLERIEFATVSTVCEINFITISHCLGVWMTGRIKSVSKAANNFFVLYFVLWMFEIILNSKKFYLKSKEDDCVGMWVSVFVDFICQCPRFCPCFAATEKNIVKSHGTSRHVCLCEWLIICNKLRTMAGHFIMGELQ